VPASDTGVRVTELRLLEGPNLYFTRPTVKLSLELTGYQDAPESRVAGVAAQVGLRRVKAGRPHTDQRQRFLIRLTSTVVRRVAERAGTRLAVRGRPGSTPEHVVVAFPWRHRGRAEALGNAMGQVLADLLAGAGAETVLEEAARAVREASKGSGPSLIRPRIPVASVTGTNGKTSTTRLLAHIGMTTGRRTGWSSTEGVYIQGEQVVAGDYSGPAGARHVLTDPTVQLGVLETARGGLLLKGMGVSYNDVSVVTNVTADHLGLHGIDTVDQLAEVKAIVTRVTRKDGWVVLNGDDPRVRAMAARATGRPWMFSLDPDAPALRDALSAGGRGITVLEDDIVILRRDSDPDRLIRVLDVPMTLSGLSRHNVANALAATAAALGLGLPREAVVEGLRTFTPDLEHNPGRMNVFTIPTDDGGRGTVIIDMAHNEAGLDALLNVAEGLRPPGSRVHLGLAGVGDRTDEILVGMGELAGIRADRVHIVHKGRYLRGRTVEDLEARLVEGLALVGAVPTGSSPNEVEGLAALVEGMADGDVLAFMCHAERAAVVTWLREHGATADGPRVIRRKVVAARGEHELEQVLAAVAERTGRERIEAARTLVDQTPDDPRLVYELAMAYHADGQREEAVRHFRAALAAGLREPHRFQAQVATVLGLCRSDRVEEAARLTDELLAQRPDSPTVSVLHALVTAQLGRPRQALADLATFVVQQVAAKEDMVFRTALAEYAAVLAGESAGASA